MSIYIYMLIFTLPTNRGCEDDGDVGKYKQ